jgi:hypothetical protein
MNFADAVLQTGKVPAEMIPLVEEPQDDSETAPEPDPTPDPTPEPTPKKKPVALQKIRDPEPVKTQPSTGSRPKARAKKPTPVEDDISMEDAEGDVDDDVVASSVRVGGGKKRELVASPTRTAGPSKKSRTEGAGRGSSQPDEPVNLADCEFAEDSMIFEAFVPRVRGQVRGSLSWFRWSR